MTEDDTFRVLARLPWEEVALLRQTISRKSYTERGLASAPFFQQYGWNVVEFWKEYERREIMKPSYPCKLVVGPDSVHWVAVEDND